ncbi:MAG: hypothetical protein SGJ24_13085 [Chloroflexota bacterium]|nr:hypothetical protein [Chloroflexota bacterium]
MLPILKLTSLSRVLVGISLCMMIALPASAQEVTPSVDAPTTAATDDTAARALAEASAARAAAEEAIARADRLTDSNATLLSFLEVTSGLAALVITVGAVLGLSSLGDLRKNLTKTFEDKFEEEREKIVVLRGELDTQFAEVKNAAALVKEVRQQGDRAIRALTLVQLGEQQLRDSNWGAAQHTFTEAYRLDGKNRAVNYFLGELYIMERDLNRAEVHLRLSQGYATKKHLLDAETGLLPDDLPDSIQELADLDQEDSTKVGYPPAEAALAYVLRLRGDREMRINSRNEFYASAERRYLKALRLDNYVRDINDESVYGMLGALYRQWGRVDDAIRAYESATTSTPNRSYPLNNLAMLLYKRNHPGDIDHATKLFLRAIKLAEHRIESNPLDYWAHFDRITGQLACTLSVEAEEAFEAVLPIVQIKGPLESFRNGLNVMRSSGRNTTPLVQHFIDRVEDALVTMDENNNGSK